jgi:putative thioredoxin
MDFEQDVVERSAELPVVVDFWADWCGPCKMLAPVLEGAVAEREGKVELVKVNTDEEPELAQRFGIRGIPAVKAFRNGQVVAEFVGAQPPQKVAEFLDELTAPSLAEQLAATGEEGELAAALGRGDHETALELLLAEAQQADPERRDEIRRLMVTLFGELGHEHPLTQTYRRRLAATLY